MSWLFPAKSRMVTPDEAIPGRADYPFTIPVEHAVLGTPIRTGPGHDWPEHLSVLYLAMGCFWGAEEIYWRIPGVYTTAVGYQGGFTAFPTYEEVCTGRTGHTESVLVAYDPAAVSTAELLRTFWTRHDPTQGYRQGNDVGTQYRSAIFTTTPEQHELAERGRAAYAPALAARGYDSITTQIAPAAPHRFFYAEDYHQQYLYKVPNGYRCHSETGVPFPADAEG